MTDQRRNTGLRATEKPSADDTPRVTPSPNTLDGLRAELDTIRYRHTNIEGDDPVAVRFGVEPHRQRMCANDHEAWPCQTVQVIDLVHARLREATND